MIVCHCHRVCDRTIRAAVRAGASNEEAVGEACGAGTMCGGCLPAVSEIIEEERSVRRRLPLVAARHELAALDAAE